MEEQEFRGQDLRRHSEIPIARRRWMTVTALAIVLIAIFASLMLRQHRDEVDAAATVPPRTQGAVSLMTATARTGDIGVYVDAIGTVTPIHTSTITSQVSGMITAVRYRESQSVRKGDSLIDIDSR